MERTLKILLVIPLTLAPAWAHDRDPSSSWDDLIRKHARTSKWLSLSAGLEQGTTTTFRPKVIGFKGIISIPDQLLLHQGDGKVASGAGQLIIDGQVECNYSPRHSGKSSSRVYSLPPSVKLQPASADSTSDKKVKLDFNEKPISAASG